MKKYMNEKQSNDYFKTNDIIKIKKIILLIFWEEQMM